MIVKISMLQYCLETLNLKTLDKQCEVLSRCGYDGIEIYGYERILKDPSETRKTLSKFGLKCSSIGGDYSVNSGHDLVNKDEKIRKNCLSYVSRCMEFASQIGCSIVTLLVSPWGKPKPDIPVEKAWEYALQGLKWLSDKADEIGVYIAIEPLNRYETFMVNTLDEAIRLCKEAGGKRLGVMGDIFHMCIEEESLVKAIKSSGKLLLEMHMANNTRKEIDKGFLNFSEILNALKSIGFDGYLVGEFYPSKENYENALRKYVSLMKESAGLVGT